MRWVELKTQPICCPHYSSKQLWQLQKVFLSLSLFSLFSICRIQIISNQSRSCTAWNVSLHEFSPVDDENLHCGPVLHQFCPRDKHKQFALPWNLKTLVIKAQAMTRTAPIYTLKWKSSVTRQKIQNLTPAPNVVSRSGGNLHSLILLVITLIFNCSTLGR